MLKYMNVPYDLVRIVVKLPGLYERFGKVTAVLFYKKTLQTIYYGDLSS